MGFLTGKRALVVGIASERSIAAAIAQALHREGATLALTYQNDKLKSRVEDIAKEVNSTLVLPCDVGFDESIHSVFEEIAKQWDGLDIIVHSVGYAPADQLRGNYIEDVNREGFRTAHDISSYSFSALAKAGQTLMKGRRGALLTLTHIGSERAFPNYNVMGLAKASLEANVRYMAYALGEKNIRVNAISAGSIKTLAAAGIGGFRKMLAYTEKAAPLKRNVTLEEVGNAAAFLCSDLASGITGDIIYVDCGFHLVGMGPTE